LFADFGVWLWGLGVRLAVLWVFELKVLWAATSLQGNCSELRIARLVFPSESLLDTG
jgi:hypothetical protein